MHIDCACTVYAGYCWKWPRAAGIIGTVADTIEALERRIDELRVAVRKAVLSGDVVLAAQCRSALGSAEQAWEDALDAAAATSTAPASTAPAPAGAVAAARIASGRLGARSRSAPPAESSALRPASRPAPRSGSLLPLREQVYEALSVLQVPAAPKLIATVHEAFFGATFPTTRVTSLKRDEERSFRTAPFARPYYICAALSADRLAPSRGLLAVSTWPLELRVIGSLSPRVDFLTAAIRVAEAIERIPEPPAAARRLLQRFAASVSGAVSPDGAASPAAVGDAARSELSVLRDADARVRRAAAARARGLNDPEQLFGTDAFRAPVS
jgi:hypothetical protein